MFFANIDLKPGLLKTIAIIATIIGIVFVLTAGHIGHFAIRLAMVVTAVFCGVNLKMTYRYAGKIKKVTSILSLVGSIVVFIRPQLIFFIIGIALLYYSGFGLYKLIKNKDYSDKLKLVILIIGIVFSVFCILNANATLVLVIRLIGAIFIAIGCVSFCQFIIKSKNPQPQEDYIFEDSTRQKDIIEVEEITDIKEDK